MKFLNDLLWFASQAFEGLLFIWPITLVLLIFVCITANNYIWKEKTQFSIRHLLIFAPLLLIIGTISVGIFLRFSYRENPGARPPSWPSILIDVLFWLHIPLAVFIGYKLKDIRWLAVAIVTLEVWYAMWCSFMASMSVTDDWM